METHFYHIKKKKHAFVNHIMWWKVEMTQFDIQSQDSYDIKKLKITT